MTTTHLLVGGAPALSITLHVPPMGAWWLEAALEGDPDLSGSVEVAIGDSLTLRGTIVSGGSFADQRTVRVVAGGGGWGSLLAARAYHSDAGVTALSVAQDAATAAGETLGSFSPSAPTIGVDFVRASGPASAALEAAAGGTPWWVGFDGLTVVGTRSTSAPAPGSYQILAFDPITSIATIAADDLATIAVGSTLAAEERMPTAQTVRELRFEITPDTATIVAWCGAFDSDRGRAARALEALVRRVLAEKLYGSIRYRVMRTNGDRVELQAIAPGYPDIGPISYAPGLAGAHSTLQVGAEVLVEFIEGDRTRPRVTHFAGKDGVGWTPTATTIDASGASASIKLGANATEIPAWASKILDELTKIQVALNNAVAPAAGGALTWPPGTQYVPPVSSASLGAAKTVCE